jgi:hypothetical protein
VHYNEHHKLEQAIEDKREGKRGQQQWGLKRICGKAAIETSLQNETFLKLPKFSISDISKVFSKANAIRVVQPYEELSAQQPP